MNINEFTTVSNQAISGINKAIDAYHKWKRSKISKENKLAFLLMECQRNIALLEIIKQSDNSDQISKYLCQVAESLDISVLSNCFMDAVNGDNSILNKINELKIAVIDENDTVRTENKKAIAVACFIYQRTIIIKNIAELGLDFQKQYGIRFKTRLKNLETNMRIFSAAIASSKSQDGIWNF